MMTEHNLATALFFTAFLFPVCYGGYGQIECGAQASGVCQYGQSYQQSVKTSYKSSYSCPIIPNRVRYRISYRTEYRRRYRTLNRCCSGWTGDPARQCTPVCYSSCLNGGTCCSPNTCGCPNGYTGSRCQTPVCSPSCLNGGTCTRPNTCSCSNGYTGSRCQTPVCSSSCLNGGTCTRPNTCSCPNGYTGSRCQTPVCSSSCLNGGTCTRPNTCSCPSGYTGSRCQTPVCSPVCVNGGTCTRPNTCSCPDGYTGNQCQTPVCSPACMNAGTCTSPNACSCLDGYTGNQCQTPPGCSSLTVPSNVTVTGGGNLYGAIRAFRCPEGYTTENGASVVTSECGEDGQWTDQPPICSVKKTAAVTSAPAADPCVVSNPCEDWQTCIGVNGDAMCFCKHPQDCPYVKDPHICGTDGKNYTSLCNLKTLACFFDKDVEKELETPCPPVVEGAFDYGYRLNSADEYSVDYEDKKTTTTTHPFIFLELEVEGAFDYDYSLNSADEYSLDYEDEKTTTTTHPFTNGSFGLPGIPPSIQSDEGSVQFQPQPVVNEGPEQDQTQPIVDEGSVQFQPQPTVDERPEQAPSTLAVPVGCSEGCEMMSLEQACQNATVAFVAKISDFATAGRAIFNLDVGETYWGNIATNPLITTVSGVNNNNNNCSCPNFDISDKDHIIISQSEIKGFLRLDKTDYVAVLDGHTPLSDIDECAKHVVNQDLRPV